MNCLIDLHLHLDGSISVKNARYLAAMQEIQIPECELDLKKLLQVEPDCKDLNQFLEKFAFPLSLLQTRDSLYWATVNLLTELKSQGLMYAEIRFAPQLHCDKGLTQIQAVQDVLDGLRDCDMMAGAILCCMRGPENTQANLETVRLAKEFLRKGVVALDLAGAEGLFPTADFAQEFSLARSLGVPFTIHAGEAAGPESIWKSLEFGALRIGHGVRCLEDPDLVKELARRKIPLELCITSNIQTCIFESVEKFPIKKLIDSGILCTINTDDMVVCGTDLMNEFGILRRAFGFGKKEICTLLENSINASFADEGIKNKMQIILKSQFGF